MVAVLVAQDCVLLLVILVVRDAQEAAPEVARTVVTDVLVIVMDVQVLVKTSAKEVARTVVKAVVPVAQDARAGVLAMDAVPIALEIVALV